MCQACCAWSEMAGATLVLPQDRGTGGVDSTGTEEAALSPFPRTSEQHFPAPNPPSKCGHQDPTDRKAHGVLALTAACSV